MPRHGAAAPFTASVTRRRVVVAGARLAYATPLVAASVRLTELTARADAAVSGLRIAARGMFPPTIETVSFTAPSWVLITGRYLTDATVTFGTDGGPTAGGIVQVNTDAEVIVSIPDGLTILSTTVETPDGVAVFDQTVSPGLPPGEDLAETRLAVDEAPVARSTTDDTSVEDEAPSTEVGTENAPEQEASIEVEEETPVEVPEEAPAEAHVTVEESAPVEEQPPIEETPVEEAPVEQAPVEQAPVEQPPVEAAPVEEAPVEEAPVEVVTVEQPPFAVGVTVVARHAETKMYDVPSASGAVVMKLQEGIQVVIVGPQEANDEGIWWPVQDPGSGLVGYIVASSLKPQE